MSTSQERRALKARTFAGREVDTTLLTDEELRILWIRSNARVAPYALSAEARRRLRRTTAIAFGIAVPVCVVAMVIVANLSQLEGLDYSTAVMVTMMSCWMLLVMVGLSMVFVRAAEADRASKRARVMGVAEHLEKIGFEGRRAKPNAKQQGGRDDGGFRPYWHVDGYDHSRHKGLFSSRDRATMNSWGMDADTYRNNVLEHDPD